MYISDVFSEFDVVDKKWPEGKLICAKNDKNYKNNKNYKKI